MGGMGGGYGGTGVPPLSLKNEIMDDYPDNV